MLSLWMLLVSMSVLVHYGMCVHLTFVLLSLCAMLVRFECSAPMCTAMGCLRFYLVTTALVRGFVDVSIVLMRRAGSFARLLSARGLRARLCGSSVRWPVCAAVPRVCRSSSTPSSVCALFVRNITNLRG